jgi:thiol-disulfide isomerase/thioredoxin/outer membrane lipoprotein-sorting protein
MVRRALLAGALTLVVCAFFTPALRSQTHAGSVEPRGAGADALPFLTEVFSRYAQATTYYVKYSEEEEFTKEGASGTTESSNLAATGPGNQYRFQYRGEFQVSDGKSEWVYRSDLKQYKQKPTPTDVPSPAAILESQSLSDAPGTVLAIAHLGHVVRTAKFAADQVIQIGGKSVPCVVVTTEGVITSSEGHGTEAFTFWVEKQSSLILKLTERREFLPDGESGRQTSNATRFYSIAILNPSSFPHGTFSFDPPADALLVKNFGKPLPEASVKNAAGQEISLQSFQGKPLLLDFWAMWCGPCRRALPTFEKLYSEYKDKGLVLLSLDEDEDPQKAADFWAENKLPWPNYYLDKVAVNKFGGHAVPYVMLVDASGHMIYSRDGFDEKELRAALDSLASAP